MITDAALHPMRENPYDIAPATIVERRQEADDIISIRLQLDDEGARRRYRFSAGQFNMLYVYGVGEVAISIVSDPDEPQWLDHTIRIVGRTTRVIGAMKVGDSLGIRGAYGRGWPMEEAKGQEVLVITGGLGCAPVAGAIEYMFRRREDYGTISILHGVKAPRDFVFRERFDRWRSQPDTRVYLASDQPTKTWHDHVGVVTELFDQLSVNTANTLVMMCGPEIMMRMASQRLVSLGVPINRMFLSLERHMECGIGLCGHCQLGPFFLCKDGPVMRANHIMPFLGKTGL